MARPIVLSNGSMHVGINLFAMVHDFYYPHVGQENHAAANNRRHRIGFWVEGEFTWLDDGTWQFYMDYEPKAMISHINAFCERLGIALEFSDCVQADADVFLRNIHVINARQQRREIRLFLHQTLLIGNSLSGDTAQFLPDQRGILHYKGDRAFVAGAKTHAGVTFDQYSIGLFGIEGKQGTYRDAEDGHLQANNVEHGKVDSVLGFNLTLEGLNSTRVHYWIAAGKSPAEAIDLHTAIAAGDVYARFARTAEHWHNWLEPAAKTIDALPKEQQNATYKNLLIIKSHIDNGGAVIASTDTQKLNFERDAYAYCWPRDGAYALWPLARLGYKNELRNFFSFCAKALHPQGFLMHKYQPDGALGSSWHPYIVNGRIIPPIQEDETAIVVYLLSQYAQLGHDKKVVADFYDSLLKPAADWMVSHIDERTGLPHASYDLWEQKFLTTTYTTAVVHAALVAAAHMAKECKKQEDMIRWQTAADEIYAAAHKTLFNTEQGYFYKGFVSRDNGRTLEFDRTIDVSSFYGAFMFGLFDSKSKEVKAAYQTLLTLFGNDDAKAIPWPRYEHDLYDAVDPAGLGNPWFITTFWHAQYAVETGHIPKAKAILAWAQDAMMPSGVLSEEVSPYDNHQFVSVAPLIWSQAEFINTVLDINESDKPI